MASRPNSEYRTFAPVLASVICAAGVLLGLALSGCGGSQEPAIPPETLNRKILHLEQGVSVDRVKSQLGDPDIESSVGSEAELSYGIWQLSFTDGHLKARSKVLIPKDPSITQAKELNTAIRRLHLGTGIGEVEALLGTPEAVYLTYEGQSQPVKVLRYGPWELTFVEGVLTLRAQ